VASDGRNGRTRRTTRTGCEEGVAAAAIGEGGSRGVARGGWSQSRGVWVSCGGTTRRGVGKTATVEAGRGTGEAVRI
jgi:hypothetical protein